ncbi:MAG: ADP-ribosylglycohydrolase family protein [Propionibacteriaceae bacterium]
MGEIDQVQDRIAGVMLGTAVGDALGVPYEFSTPPGPNQDAAMLGGGLGNFAPGEWSDDTSMAVAVARVAATGADLRSTAALDAIAEGFLEWYDHGPADIGNQTRSVLSGTRRRLDRGDGGASQVMREEAQSYARSHAHSAGNGAVMRTAAVAWAHLDDRESCAEAAQAIALLTHADPLAADSCVMWSEAIRVAIVDGAIRVDAGLDLLPEERRTPWAAWLADAMSPTRELVPGRRFTPNGYTVTAVQAAVAAITLTPAADSTHLAAALHAAVRIGNDTDTVAAIAGGLLGARWGASAVPAVWRAAVHGWPGLTGEDLVTLAPLTAP